MRYLIIDLQDFKGDIQHDNLGLEEGRLLKPEESLVKFKEIWDRAIVIGTTELKLRIRELVSEGKAMMGVNGGDSNLSVGVLVKIKDLI